VEVLSWVGSFLLAICGLPIAYEAYKTKTSDISTSFLLLWGFGEIFTFIYVVYKEENALTFNYFSNIIFIGIIVYYKFKKKDV
jgi:hypothetical protein|tara:strand:- start:650 stop:898 length:249 start_codon:yes stop_codon:yes gene_type:complete